MAGVVERLPERDEEHPDSVAFALHKPVDLAKLDRELAEAHGWDGPTGLTVEGVVGEVGSDPATLWVHHPDVRANLMRSVVDAHEVTNDNDIEALRQKALADEDLSDTEIQQALRALLRRAR